MSPLSPHTSDCQSANYFDSVRDGAKRGSLRQEGLHALPRLADFERTPNLALIVKLTDDGRRGKGGYSLGGFLPIRKSKGRPQKQLLRFNLEKLKIVNDLTRRAIR